MNKKKNSHFGSLQPPFPQTGFILYHFLADEEGIFGIYPITTLFSSKEEAIQEINLVAIEWEKRGFTVPESCILLTAQLQKLYPNEKRFWENPTQHYSVSALMTTFLPVVENPQFYKLLTTASYFDNESKWEFRTALPLYLTAHEKLIEQFMLHSDHPVDERASSSAIYTLSAPNNLNRITGQISMLQKEEYKIQTLN